MLIYIGLIFFFGLSIQLPRWFLRKAKEPIKKSQFLAAEYVAVSLILYFCGKPVFFATVMHQNNPSLQASVGIALIFAGISLIAEYLILTRAGDIFKRLAISTLNMLIASILIMLVMGPGIVNIVWAIVLPGAMCGYFLAIEFTGAVHALLLWLPKIAARGERKKILEESKKEADRLLKLAAQSFFALAASVGVSMSILFKGGSEAWRQLDYQATAAQMVLGVLLVTFGLLFSFAKPYLGIVAKVNEMQLTMYAEAVTGSDTDAE